MKKGFTLVELLAVVIILGVLAAILIPKITNTLKDAELNTNMESARNLAKSAQLKYSNNEMIGDNTSININYSTGENIDYLDYQGTKPEKGKLHIKANGKIAMAVKFGDLCYLKAYNSDDITAIEYNEDICNENAFVFTNYTMPQTVNSGPGLYESTTEPGRYIYRGNDTETQKVNNWIWLDENGDGEKTDSELYRIISYENDDTIKVIRENSIGTIKWDNGKARKNTNSGYYCTSSYGCNVWGNQSNTYYNDATISSLGRDFYFQYYLDSTAENLTNGAGGAVSTDSYLNTYLNNTWYDTISFKNIITEHRYNVGGIYHKYNYDTYLNGDKGIKKEKEEESLLFWYGKIGLMNITEYVESSLNPTCTSVYSNYWNNIAYEDGINGKPKKEATINDWPCSNQNYNWMSVGIDEWSLTAASYYRDCLLGVDSSGYFPNFTAYVSHEVRPAFYLKSSISLTGFGTKDSPYRIVTSS